MSAFLDALGANPGKSGVSEFGERLKFGEVEVWECAEEFHVRRIDHLIEIADRLQRALPFGAELVSHPNVRGQYIGDDPVVSHFPAFLAVSVSGLPCLA